MNIQGRHLAVTFTINKRAFFLSYICIYLQTCSQNYNLVTFLLKILMDMDNFHSTTLILPINKTRQSYGWLDSPRRWWPLFLLSCQTWHFFFDKMNMVFQSLFSFCVNVKPVVIFHQSNVPTSSFYIKIKNIFFEILIYYVIFVYTLFYSLDFACSRSGFVIINVTLWSYSISLRPQFAV